jgi:putative spermidine/putrescine transport system substrate-binding protein
LIRRRAPRARGFAIGASILACAMLGACTRSERRPAPPLPASWAGVVAAARGQTVTIAMWRGDPAVNAYMQDEIAPALRRSDDIRLRFVPAEGEQIVSGLMTEIEAHRRQSQYDIVWINGATFYQLRQIHALFGPFTARLPNARYIDWRNPYIAEDFQQPIQGYECPWGNAQLMMITDSRRVPHPPTDPARLAAWIHRHPGRFTFDTSFTGLSFLKSLMYAFAANPAQLQGPFDQVRYRRLRDAVFGWIRSVRPDLWRHGATFPQSTAQLDQLFADGEVDFTMSFTDGEVDHRVADGAFPPTAEGFSLRTGMIQNSHYLGIVARSAHVAAAMVVINDLISPRAQWRKLDPAVWGDGTVLDLGRLPPRWRARFAAAARRAHAPSRAALQAFARPEPSAQLMIALSKDFRHDVLEH